MTRVERRAYLIKVLRNALTN